MSSLVFQQGEIDREPHIGVIMDEMQVAVAAGMRVLIIDPCHGRMPKWFAVRQAQVDVVCLTERRAEKVQSECGEGINIFRIPPGSFLSGCLPQTYDLVVCVDWPIHPDKLDLLAQGRKVVRWGGQMLIVCPETEEAKRLGQAMHWEDQHSYAAGLDVMHRFFIWRKEPGWLLSSYPRTGTHMLITALDQHPDLSCLGEVFNPNHPAGAHGMTSTQQVLEACWPGPNYGFAMHCYIARKGGASGFQPPQKPFRDVWDHLPPIAKAVCIRRRNLLARHVSHVKANETKIWFGSRKGPNKKAVRVDPVKALRDIAFVQECWRQQDAFFKVKHVVWYEDLVEKFDEVCRGVQAFLGVTTMSIAPTTTKLGRPLRDDVENFGYLRQALAGKVPDAWFKE